MWRYGGAVLAHRDGHEANERVDDDLPHLGWYFILKRATQSSVCRITGEIRWDEFYMALSATTINENGKHWQYAVPRRVVQRSSTLLVLESPRMSLTRDALWHNGL